MTVPDLDNNPHGQSESLWPKCHQVYETSQASSAGATPSPNEKVLLEHHESVLQWAADKLLYW